MNPAPEERKAMNRASRGQDDEEESSLTREKNSSGTMKDYRVVDGEFASFPEIMATSAQ